MNRRDRWPHSLRLFVVRAAPPPRKIVEPKGFDLADYQARRCQNPECRLLCLPGSGKLKHGGTLCGKCSSMTVPPSIALPPCERPETPDEPPQHAA